MSTIHRGKIGRLPPNVREAVNRRLEAGERGPALGAWLNSLPEVQAILTADFRGKPITKQNLSQWRKYGYRDWLRLREARTMLAELRELPLAPDKPVTDQLAAWGSVRYLMAVRELVRNHAPGVSHLDTVRQFTRDAIALRRADYRAARLQFQKERAEIYDEHTQMQKDLTRSRQ